MQCETVRSFTVEFRNCFGIQYSSKLVMRFSGITLANEVQPLTFWVLKEEETVAVSHVFRACHFNVPDYSSITKVLALHLG